MNEVNIIQIACGAHHVVAVSIDNKVFSWGSCKYGALGLGNQFSSFPTHIQSSLFGKKIVKIACAQNCTLLLLENGDVLAAGRNNDNKLGFGDKILRSMFFVRHLNLKIVNMNLNQSFRSFRERFWRSTKKLLTCQFRQIIRSF